MKVYRQSRLVVEINETELSELNAALVEIGKGVLARLYYALPSKIDDADDEDESD